MAKLNAMCGNRLTTAILFTLIVAATTAFSRAMFADSAPHIDGSWLMDFRTVCAVGAVVLLGTWRIGRWMKGIEDKLAIGDERFGRIENNMTQRNDILNDIHVRMSALPCGECFSNVAVKKGQRDD